MASLPSVDDLAIWLGVEITNEDRAEAIRAAAYTLVRSKSGRAWVDASGVQLEDVDDDDFEAVRTVIMSVWARVWTNPNGDTQQTTGPFSRSVAAWASLGLSLSDAELDMLPRAADSARPALWTLATTRVDPDTELADIYLEVEGSELIPHVPVGEVNW